MIRVRETQKGKWVFDVLASNGAKLAQSSTRYGSKVGAYNGAYNLLKALNGNTDIKF